MSDVQEEMVSVPRAEWEQILEFVASQKAASQTQDPSRGLDLRERMEKTSQQTVVWVENLSSSASRFKHKDQGFYLEAHGYVGSVQQIPAELSTLPYVQRAIQRGILRVVGDSEEAWKRLDELKMPEVSGDHERDEIIEAMSEGFEDKADHRYKKPLPEFGIEGPGWTPEQVFGQEGSRSQTVAEARNTPTEALGPQPEFVKDFVPLEGPISPEEALEDTSYGQQ